MIFVNYYFSPPPNTKKYINYFSKNILRLDKQIITETFNSGLLRLDGIGADFNN